jgi:peroxiredoxin
VRRLRYLGVAAAATGKADRAMQSIVELETLRAKLRVEIFGAGAKAEAAAKADKKKPEQVKKARESAQREKTDLIESIKKAVAHIAGQQAIAAGDFASALDQWTLAEVSKEQLSQLQFKAGDNAKAIDLAKGAADAKKGQTFPLANYVDILFRTGKTDDAKAAFEKLREFSSGIDLKAPPYARLAPVAAAMNLPADWRKPYNLPADVGTRPALDSLGSLRWKPWDAPDISAITADGAAFSLSSYRGKPVVVLFYLGYGCLHCQRQLQAFAPMTKEFADAGISVVAISTDAPADLHRAWESAKTDDNGSGFPFPLASDNKLDAFRRFGCYDDFEKMPLHGTFLIDANGKVRWREIGAEPFTDARFFIDESKRLLAQPAQ